MKTFALCLVALLVVSHALPATVDESACQTAVIELTQKLADNKLAQDQKVSYILQNLTPALNSCGLQQVADQLQLSSTCAADLFEGLRLIQKIITSTNQFSKSFDLLLLAKTFKFQIKKSCTFLSDVDIDLKSSGVCLESAYQLSLTVQTIWDDLIQGKTGAALKNFETFLDDVPDTLDACGDHALADKIRKDFPAACLKSFEDLAKELAVVEHNFDHWEWLAKHWKDVEKVLGEVKSTCPLFKW